MIFLGLEEIPLKVETTLLAILRGSRTQIYVEAFDRLASSLQAYNEVETVIPSQNEWRTF